MDRAKRPPLTAPKIPQKRDKTSLTPCSDQERAIRGAHFTGPKNTKRYELTLQPSAADSTQKWNGGIPNFSNNPAPTSTTLPLTLPAIKNAPPAALGTKYFNGAFHPCCKRRPTKHKELSSIALQTQTGLPPSLTRLALAIIPPHIKKKSKRGGP